MTQVLGMPILLYLAVINVVAFAAYGADKYKAQHGQWRIPEKTLLGLALIGGAAGALAGMFTFRHKTKHLSFLILVPLMLVGWIVLLGWMGFTGDNVLETIGLNPMEQSVKDESVDREKVRKMALWLHEKYPKATLQDVYKTCYQDYFGAEHMVKDEETARAYLHQELEQMKGEKMHIISNEMTGWRHKYVRRSLKLVQQGKLDEEALLTDFLQAASHYNNTHARIEQWMREWTEVAAICIEAVPEWADSSLEDELLECAKQAAAVHHSRAYHDAYHPHYRIVKNEK
ncbi:MAG: DUF1294 domain-containing protein [Paludibacteraceae bacterium]|nr:DUF1294 domain-containing protein [Paludibacteraceae bacterium]